MRGEFIRGDGLVLPNNITQGGAGRILDHAFRNYAGRLGITVGNGVYTPDLQFGDMQIPTNIVGYFTELTRTLEDWPILESLNGEFYIESRPVVFPAGTYPFAVSRCLLFAPGEAFVMALSSPFPAPLLITPATPEAERTFRYRLYLR